MDAIRISGSSRDFHSIEVYLKENGYKLPPDKYKNIYPFKRPRVESRALYVFEKTKHYYFSDIQLNSGNIDCRYNLKTITAATYITANNIKPSKQPADITIGCDPEFAIRKNGTPIPASNLFESNAPVGCDGYNQTGELRPGFSKDPRALVAKIQKQMEYIHAQYPDIEILSGHQKDRSTLGGHIHIGHPAFLDSGKELTLLMGNTELLVDAFLDSIDNKSERASRTASGYGHKHAWRRQEHGQEYRTPLSWLLSPAIALATLSLAKVAAIYALQGVSLTGIKGKSTNTHFIQDLINRLMRTSDAVKIPEDTLEGLYMASSIVSLGRKKVDWSANILGNWIKLKEVA